MCLKKNSAAARTLSVILIAASFLLFSGFKNSPDTSGLTIQNVSVSEDSSLLDRFSRHTVTGITTELPQVPDVTDFTTAGYLTIGDIDRDGIKEILCTSLLGESIDREVADSAVVLFTWDGKDIDSWTQTVLNDTFAFANETVLRDIDNDTDTDIMVLDNFIFGDFAGGIYYLENQGGDITDPSNWIKREIYTINDESCCYTYHRAAFVDLDGDGLEDMITTRLCLQNSFRGEQYTWLEWFKKENDNGTYPGGFSGPYEIGDGAGFVFRMFDVDKDGDQDILAPQFFITRAFGRVRGSRFIHNPRGDSLRWFENPGTGESVFEIWNSYTIDNWYSSANPMGKVYEVVVTDIQNDGTEELIVGTHNHQDYMPGRRVWPSGIFLLEVPDTPRETDSWLPVTIDSGNPDLNPNDEDAVAQDPYAVDRPGGPTSQGSPGLVRAADMTGDGLPEIVVSGDGKGADYYYENGGVTGATLSLMRATLYKDVACMPAEAEIVDIDGDGDQDIVAAIYDTSVNKDSTSSSIFIFEQQ
jgi:hypothetical protein